MPIDIVIADDHTIFRSGLKMLLSSESDIVVVGEAADGAEAIELVTRLKPRVVLMDIGMPGMSGFDATLKIKELAPETQILVLTMHRSDEYFFQMLEAGASGYILKGAETHDLVTAVRTVARGETFLYPAIAGRLVKKYLENAPSPGEGQVRLSNREREIIKLIADGYTNRQIAEMLFISPSTVHSHRTNLMQKLNLKTRHELVRYARENDLF